MATSEAQKKAAAKYHKENISSLACRVKKDQADKFKAYCMSIGKTSNSVLREYVLSCIDKDFETVKSVNRTRNVSPGDERSR
jgi:hypothetical protein